jgi:hypothetical protein
VDAAGCVFHKILSPHRSTPTHKVTHNQLGISVDANPGPNVSPADFFLFGRCVLLLGTNIGPDFIALETANPDIANVHIVVLHTCFAKVNQQFGDRVPSDTGHSGGGAKAVSFHQSGHNPDALVLTKQVHIDYYA